MASDGIESPWWLAWVLPITALVTAIGGAIVWVARKLFLDYVRDEFSRTLDEKHDANIKEFEELRRKMDCAEDDRRKMQEELADVKADLAYLRGRATGSFKKPSDV